MDTLQFSALRRWSELTREGVLAVTHNGRILLLNARLRERLALQTFPQTTKVLLTQVSKNAPGLKRLLLDDFTSPQTAWGSLQIEGRPAQQMLWERAPLVVDDEMVGTLFIFRDAVSEGQRELAKQSFLSMISHDLRTPLSTILGFAELFYNNRDTLGREEQAEFLEHIIDNATQLSRYIQIALDVMYLEADLQNFETEVVSLQHFVKHWIADAAYRLSVHQLTFQNGAGGALLAYASPEALHRILYILAEFALAEAPEAEVVRLDLRTDSLYAHVIIAHRAPELRPEDIPNLFRITHPRDLSDVGRPKLHRMQLYVAHLLAERQQGHLSIHERPEQVYELDLAMPLVQALDTPVPDDL